jgi:lipopolysaccharide transport system ATP-binding protein
MIAVDSLSKRFKLYRSPADRLKEIVTGKKFHTDFQALRDVSFSIADGRTLGIVGQNGAGKSTLLKILTGVLLPDAGTIQVNGKITGLLELGTGFNAEMTGIDNIYMNGTLLGMSRDEIDEKRQAIIAFTELGDFIYEQLKTYSSGMTMRLAFSIAIHADPKCFVVDEALSVGDAHFQQKCMARIRRFRESGGSIIFVSHDLNAVKLLCDEAILLDRGTVVERGDPEQVVNRYNFLLSKLNDREGAVSMASQDERSHGTSEARITAVTIKGRDSRSPLIEAGEPAIITVTIDSAADCDDVTSGILIRDRFGQDIFGTNLALSGVTGFSIRKGMRYQVTYDLLMNLGPGRYTITAAIHRTPEAGNRRLHWVDSITEFEIAGNRGDGFIGVCKLQPSVGVREEPAVA